MKRIYLALLLIFTFFSGKATHIVGGELYYKYLGNNQYQIQLTVYRDCFYGVPPFDEPAYIGIWNSNNVQLNTLSLFTNDSATVPPIINSPCFIPPTNVCYRVANYYTTVTLPPISGGYQLAYQRCCRNQTILNIVDPLNTGATFYARIPGSNVQTPSKPATQNGNPVFNELPPPFICSGLSFVFDHSATDPDGDSLVYEICTPYNGASVSSPLPGPPTVPPTVGTLTDYPPPFATVIYQPPFNLGNLLGGTALSIDTQTGLLTAVPNTIGQFVIGICVNEYRDGVFLSKTRRDYQLNVVACPTLVVAALQTPVLTCGSNFVQFNNNSFGASTYSWNFGDPSTTNDVSTAVNPSYTYPGLGTYNVTLIAYSTFNPGCADTTVGQVTIAPDYTIDFSYALTSCSPNVQFTDTSNSASGITNHWIWTFGDGSGIDTTHNPTHTFPGPGTYTVTFQGTSVLGCKETIVKTVVIPPYVSLSATSGQVTCNNLCTGQSTANTSSGIGPFTFIWSNSQTSQTALNLCPGTYTVTVTDSLGCTATATSTIGNPPVLTADASATPAYCDGQCIGTTIATYSGGTGPFTVEWNDPGSQTGIVATGLCPGFYSAIVTDINGCSDTTPTVEVIYDSFIPPLEATISDDEIYVGQAVNLLAIANGNFSYSWTPVQGLSSSTIQNPIATPSQNTTYYVVITDPFGCSNTDSVSVVVKEVSCQEPVIYIPNAFTPNNDNNNDVVYVRGNTIRDLDFKIFDRWGEKVFETTDPKKGWDGYYKGTLATPAVYDYYVEAVCFDGQRFFKKGNITLIR